MNGTPSIRSELVEDIAVVTLDDGKANAMRPDWFEGLHAALDRAEQAKVRALHLRGRPGMFSGGLDLKFLPTLAPEGLPAFTQAFARTLLRVWTFPVPTVAEVTGHAIAGGCVLASACDRRFGLAGAFRIQMNEHLIGIHLPSWMRVILAAAWPAPELERLLLLGEVYTPDRAGGVGVLDGVAIDEASLREAARAAAAGLKLLNPASVAVYKQRFRQPLADEALARLERE